VAVGCGADLRRCGTNFVCWDRFCPSSDPPGAVPPSRPISFYTLLVVCKKPPFCKAEALRNGDFLIILHLPEDEMC